MRTELRRRERGCRTALSAAGVVLLLTACAEPATQLTPDRARSDARSELARLADIGDLDWPMIKAGVPNECDRNGDGVLFSWAAHTSGPADPESYIRAVDRQLRDDGYHTERTKTDTAERGTLFIVGARAAGRGKLRVSATTTQAAMVMDSACTPGVAEDYRPADDD